MKYSRFIKKMKEWDVEYRENYDVSRLSRIRIGGIVRLLVSPDSEKKLIGCVRLAADERLPSMVVGRFSNLLFAFEYYDGIIVKTDKINNYSRAENNISCGCGVALPRLIRRAADIGLCGCEELCGIPGSIGGVVSSNAGAFGKQMSDVVCSVRVYDPHTDAVSILKNEECAFRYRGSIFRDRNYVILSAVLRFVPGQREEIERKIADITARRMALQPYSEPSLGSVFKRHGDIPVSRLIDELGMKGYRVGGASISRKHAGFIINDEGATAADVIALIDEIKRRVQDTFSFTPQEEIEIVK